MLRSVQVLLAGLMLAGCQKADAVGTGTDGSSQQDAAVQTGGEKDRTAASAAKTSADRASAGRASTARASAANNLRRITPVPDDKLPQTEAQWKRKLTAQQFYVLRKHGTERAFTRDYGDLKEHVIFHCAGCGDPLFDSQTKFDSGTGWPSFYDVIGEVGENVGTRIDRSLFTTRIEVHCRRCGGHLGHVFDDGPAPTGLRYCINSAAIKPGAPPADEEAESEGDSTSAEAGSDD
jgi:peptide-methionine (R)-S-oxide reductase